MERVATTHCLDACAVIAYLRQEPGAEVLQALIEQPTTFLVMHVCNLGEVYYSMIKFFVLDVLLRQVVAVSSDPAPDRACAPSFFGRPSGQLP